MLPAPSVSGHRQVASMTTGLHILTIPAGSLKTAEGTMAKRDAEQLVGHCPPTEYAETAARLHFAVMAMTG